MEYIPLAVALIHLVGIGYEPILAISYLPLQICHQYDS